MTVRVLAAHPSPDRYGADLMFVEALRGMRERGLHVTAMLPEEGSLVDDLRGEGIDVEILDVPVIRKALLRPAGLLGLAGRSLPALVRLVRAIRRTDPDVVYVNTITVPHWLAAARLARRPAVCHVREAEDGVARPLQLLLTAPLLLAARVITNSRHTASHLAGLWRRLARRSVVVHNGFAPRRAAAPVERVAPPARLAVVGRLSPRKGQHVAVAALDRLVRDGRDVVLHLFGTAFPGYEWYVEQLHADAARAGVADRVVFEGYRQDPSGAYADAALVLVPSLTEPFGNVAVEGQLAGRAVIASATGGLREIVSDGITGVLVPPGDHEALAAAIGSLLDDDVARQRMASSAASEARERFGFDRYRRAITDELERTVAAARPTAAVVAE